MIVKRTIHIDEKDEDFFSSILKSFAVPNANDLGGHGLNFGQKRADRRHIQVLVKNRAKCILKLLGSKLRLGGPEVVVVLLPEWFWSLSLQVELTRKTVQKITCL